MEITAKMLAKALWETGPRSSDQPEKFDDLDEQKQRWHSQSAKAILQHLTDQRPDAIQYKEPGEAEQQFQDARTAIVLLRDYFQTGHGKICECNNCTAIGVLFKIYYPGAQAVNSVLI
ncbi:hypothetical protein LCGC14_2462260 [marine sediment metagenome]|uniref:Uncharacterized protein n=1 Tax=marine sediment metagenome TaxID=412755 RepID=A0A0F9E6W8_9ZZZZ